MGSDAYFSGPGAGVQSAQKIQSGTIQMMASGVGSGGVIVTFPVAFNSVPAVTLGWTTGSGSAIGYVQLAALPTTTGFNISLQSGNGSTLYTFFWIAVGT